MSFQVEFGFCISSSLMTKKKPPVHILVAFCYSLSVLKLLLSRGQGEPRFSLVGRAECF